MTQFDIDNTLKNLPEKPGVYRFYGAGDTPLYIGKAKVLKNRVSSYFMAHRLADNPRLQLMVEQIERVDYTVVSTERDAIILEANLIHNLQPKFNILLKDDRNYLYVRITAPLTINAGYQTKGYKESVQNRDLENLETNIEISTIQDNETLLDYDNILYEVKKNLNFVPIIEKKTVRAEVINPKFKAVKKAATKNTMSSRDL